MNAKIQRHDVEAVEGIFNICRYGKPQIDSNRIGCEISDLDAPNAREIVRSGFVTASGTQYLGAHMGRFCSVTYDHGGHLQLGINNQTGICNSESNALTKILTGFTPWENIQQHFKIQ